MPGTAGLLGCRCKAQSLAKVLESSTDGEDTVLCHITHDTKSAAPPAAQVHYMFGATFRQQVRHLERYAAEHGYNPATRVDVIISVMVRKMKCAACHNIYRRSLSLGHPNLRSAALLLLAARAGGKPVSCSVSVAVGRTLTS